MKKIMCPTCGRSSYEEDFGRHDCIGNLKESWEISLNEGRIRDAKILALKARIAELEAAIMRAVKILGTYPLDIGIRKTMADLRKLVKGE